MHSQHAHQELARKEGHRLLTAAGCAGACRMPDTNARSKEAVGALQTALACPYMGGMPPSAPPALSDVCACLCILSLVLHRPKSHTHDCSTLWNAALAGPTPPLPPRPSTVQFSCATSLNAAIVLSVSSRLRAAATSPSQALSLPLSLHPRLLTRSPPLAGFWNSAAEMAAEVKKVLEYAQRRRFEAVDMPDNCTIQ